MEKQKKSVGTIALVILLLIVTIVSLVLATYAWAKYTTTTPKENATAVVAKWDVNASVNGTATWSKTFNHVVPTKLAPGTSGVIPVTVDASGSEVCVHYEVYVTGIANKPKHLIFYEGQESSGNFTKLGNLFNDTTALNVENATVSGDVKVFDGYLALTNDNTVKNPNKVTRYLMWDWPYAMTGEGNVEEYDAIDTADGNAAKTMSVSIKVVMTQVDPNSAIGIDD